MKNFLLSKIFIIWVIFFPVLLPAQDTAPVNDTQPVIENEYVEEVINGELDWNKGMIYAIGYGVRPDNAFYNKAQAKLMSKAAAEADALSTLAGIINGVRINSESIIEDHILTKKTVKTQINAFIKNSVILKTTYTQDGICEVKIGLPITGDTGIIALLDNLKIIPEQGKKKLDTEKLQSDTQVRPDEIKAKTGIIIDASGLDLKTSLTPMILSENNNIVFNPADIDRQWLIKYGAVGYAYSVEKALNDKRIGNNPLIIKAVDSAGKIKTNPVISKKDAELIMKNYSDILNECRIIFVIGKGGN